MRLNFEPIGSLNSVFSTTNSSDDSEELSLPDAFASSDSPKP